MQRDNVHTVQKGGFGGKKPEIIEIRAFDYSESATDQSINVPYEYGMRWIDHLLFIDRKFKTEDKRVTNKTSYRKCPNPKHPLAPAGQEAFFEDALHNLIARANILLEAPTGCGKTVCALYCAYHLKQKLLVIVPSEALATQWKKEAMNFLGATEDEISIVATGHKKVKNASVTIAVINSAASDNGMHDHIFEEAGLTIFDEAHRLGAPTFSKVMQKAKSFYRMACTATPDRKDGLMKMVTDHFGEVAVKGQVEALPCTVKPINYVWEKGSFLTKINRLPSSTLMNVVALNERRNKFIIDTLLSEVREEDCVLLIGDRVKQLQVLRSLLIRSKRYKAEEIGFFANSAYVGDEKVTISKEHHDEVKSNNKIRVVLSTYKRMKEGVDIPRLSLGIDVTPQSDGIQTIGRVRRPIANKLQSRWLTIIDKGVTIYEALGRKRIADYLKAGATFE